MCPVLLSGRILTINDTAVATTTPNILLPVDIKAEIEKEFGVDSIMVKIASCESHFRQFDKNGEVLRGEQNPLDRGIFQINEYYHLENSKQLGYDIYTIKGNIGYARYLYDKNGTRDWGWSKFCWKK